MTGVEIVVPVALFLAIVLILVAFFTARYLTRKQVHGTIRQAIDKGQELTPEILERLGETPKSPESDLRRGLIAVGIALAFGMFSFALGEDDARGPLLGIAAFPLFIGLADLGLWKFMPKRGGPA
ncbi:MAG: DUF6249 domain-containing protein [Gammaproteobacteria bacterium]